MQCSCGKDAQFELRGDSEVWYVCECGNEWQDYCHTCGKPLKVNEDFLCSTCGGY
ncbi:hypothetical protein M0R01_01715 [bacterium]|nr:hypothetical protein [bacterium]